MRVLVVYDTSQNNCSKLHRLLKKYLLWNQRSCFEGEVTEAELFEIQKLVEKEKAPRPTYAIISGKTQKLSKRSKRENL